MKKLMIALAAATLLAANVQASDSVTKGKVTFDGQMSGLTDSLIVLKADNNSFTRLDTVLVKDGKFHFTVSLDQPTDLYIYSPGTLRHTEHIGFTAIAVPGEKATITGDQKAYYFSGSKFYEQYGAVDRVAEEAMKPLRLLEDSLTERMKKGEPQAQIMKEYDAKEPALLAKGNQQILDFIGKHNTSEGCAAYIPSLNDLELMKKAAGLLSDDVRNGRMKSYYQAAIDQAQKQAEKEAEQAKKQGNGTVAPDFTLNDLNSKPLSLSSLKGKYVLLDFWGTWCIWCVRGIPMMKEYYNKYKGKFEILSIDCNETEDKWKAGVKKYDLPWLHVYNPRNTKVLDDYGITGFPTKILVGPDGKIVKTFIGEDPAFYKFLDEQFGK